MSGLVIILLVLALAVGGPTTPMSSRDAGELRVELSVPRAAFALGEAVAITLRVVNPGSTPVAVTMPTSQNFDILVRQRGALVWQWSHDKAFLQVVREHIIGPGDALTYTVAWSQRDLQERPVEPGSFEVSAVFLGAQRSGPRTIEVGPTRIVLGR